MNVLLELLELWRMDSSKVLIFSYSLKLLDLIEVQPASRSQTSRKNARRLSVGDTEPNMCSASQFPKNSIFFFLLIYLMFFFAPTNMVHSLRHDDPRSAFSSLSCFPSVPHVPL